MRAWYSDMLNNESTTETTETTGRNLTATREEIAHLGEELATLEARLHAARSGVHQVVRAATAVGTIIQRKRPSTTNDLRAMIEVALTRESMDARTLALATDELQTKVDSALRTLREQRKIYNVSNEEHPRWTWIIGDNTSAPQLNQVVRRLLAEQPMTTKELVEATGARATRISGALVAIQRGNDKILDLAKGGRAARWFVVEDGTERKLATRSRA